MSEKPKSPMPPKNLLARAPGLPSQDPSQLLEDVDAAVVKENVLSDAANEQLKAELKKDPKLEDILKAMKKL